MNKAWNEQNYLLYCDVIRDTYREALRQPDDYYPVWPGRAVYDWQADPNMTWEASCAKHLRECREALGLPVRPSPPLSGYLTVWPRRGLSYYTSLTDPRVNPWDFFAQLNEADANMTRTWLIDAWANGRDKGIGCYDGSFPWPKLVDGKFDLEGVNGPYFARLREYVEAANDAGVLPVLTGWELYAWSNRKQGMLWVPSAELGPFRHNVQGVYYAGDDAFERIGLPNGDDYFLTRFYRQVVNTLTGLHYAVELGNEMPEKPLHERLLDAWRSVGFTGPVLVNRQDDTPGQYDNMKVGRIYDRISFHGKADLSYLDEFYPDEPVYPNFRTFFDHGRFDAHRIVLSSDGCRKSTNPDDAYDYDALAEVFQDALRRGFSIEHQSRMKLRGFTEGYVTENDLEVDWFRSL